jgi:hypothetical protein
MTTLPASDILGELSAALDRLDSPTEEAATQVAGIKERLSGPLRVVLAGRVSSGKSTLVNAILGQRVAPTDVSECTQVVTWFRYGTPQRIDIRLRDGSVVQRPLERDGRLPAELGVPVSEVAGIDAWLANDSLRTLTLVDTPGFSAGATAVPDAIDDPAAGDSWRAASRCDAMIFVLNQGLRADELDVLQAFQRSQPGPASAVNALGVLTKADKLGNGAGDPWQGAATLAKRYADRHRDDVADVLPVMGLLAETTECGLLGDRELAALQALVERDETTSAHMLLSVDAFLNNDTAVPTEMRERLLELLDLYGIERALAMVRDGTDTAGRLRSALAHTSGIRDVRQVIADSFGGRATTLRLLWTAEVVQQLSYSAGIKPEDGRRLRDIVEKLRLDPAMHAINELNALQEICRGSIELPADLAEDFRRLVLNRDPVLRLAASSDRPDDLRVAAQEGSALWRRFRAGATPTQDRIARVAIRSYQLAFASADQNPGTP